MSSIYSNKVSPSRVRPVDLRDASAICCQLIKAAEKASYKEVVRDLDIDAACTALVTGEVEAVILDEAYLVSCAVVNPWYKRTTVIAERIVLRVGSGSKFKVVVDYLDDVAHEHGATSIVVGGALAVKTSGLSRLYQRFGYKIEDAPTLVKGTNYGFPTSG